MKKRRLPPLNPLKSFEAAARNGSFTKAAAELNVSPVAISHQVSVLEGYFGIKLFVRKPQLVRLTTAGREFESASTTALDLLDRAANHLRRPPNLQSLTVCTYPSFALGWLIPRLHRFRSIHPDIEINISTAVKSIELDYDVIDFAIMFGSQIGNGVTVEPILPDVFQPVCSPALLDDPYPPTSAENLRHHTLLHSHYRRLDWSDWLQGADIKGVEPGNELHFKGCRLAHQAAAEGLGVAVAQRLLVASEIASGRLVAPIEPAVQRASSYSMIFPYDRLDNVKINAFRSWVHEEATQTIDTLSLPQKCSVPNPGVDWLKQVPELNHPGFTGDSWV